MASPPAQSTLDELAAEVAETAKLISAYSLVAAVPPATFGPDSPDTILQSSAPQHVLAARQKLIQAAYKIQQLVSEPTEYIPNLQVHYQHLACLQWICHFNVLPCIPLQGSVPYSEVASLAEVPEAQLRSVCRMLMTSNFLCEPKADEVAHNNVSSSFITNPGFVDWALFVTQFSMPAAAHMTQATAKWGNSTKKTETAVNLAMNTDMPLFDFIAKSPEMTKMFAAYMKNVQNSEGTSLKHLVNGYDWAKLGDAVVVDIGGSTGSAAIALANAYPSLHFVVQDLPDTIVNANNTIQKEPENIRSRIATHTHSFFSPQPVKEAQVYLMRMILHDWPLTEAQAILRNHVAVLKHDPQARLVIMDSVLPSLLVGQTEDQVRGHDMAEAVLRVRDLTMMQSFNSKERELSEFIQLLTSTADEEGCLVLKKVTKPPGSVLSVLEVAYEKFEVQMSMQGPIQATGQSAFSFEPQLGGLSLRNASSHTSSTGSDAESGPAFVPNVGGNAFDMTGINHVGNVPNNTSLAMTRVHGALA